MLVSAALLQRHRDGLNCRACGEPILEDDAVVRRRVNSKAHWFHVRCMYSEAKHAAEA